MEICSSATFHARNVSMEHRLSWEVCRFSAGQEIACILYNPKVNYSIHKSQPRVPVQSQINPVHAPSHFLNFYVFIILPSWSIVHETDGQYAQILIR